MGLLVAMVARRGPVVATNATVCVAATLQVFMSGRPHLSGLMRCDLALQLCGAVRSVHERGWLLGDLSVRGVPTARLRHHSDGWPSCSVCVHVCACVRVCVCVTQEHSVFVKDPVTTAGVPLLAVYPSWRMRAIHLSDTNCTPAVDTAGFGDVLGCLFPNTALLDPVSQSILSPLMQARHPWAKAPQNILVVTAGIKKLRAQLLALVTAL